MGSCIDTVDDFTNDDVFNLGAQVEDYEADKIADADKCEGVLSSDVFH